MSDVQFDLAFSRSMGNEGAYKCEREDRGDWTSGIIGKGELRGTKYGISAMSYPTLDIKNLTYEQAKEIYYRDWWVKLGLGNYPKALPYQLFDAAINHGWHNVAEMIQRAVGVKDDGNIGPVTMKAIQSVSEADLVLLFLAERLEFFTNIATWSKYGKGWATRVAANLRYAAKDN